MLSDSDQIGSELFEDSKKGWQSDMWDKPNDRLSDQHRELRQAQERERFPAAYGSTITVGYGPTSAKAHPAVGQPQGEHSWPWTWNND